MLKFSDSLEGGIRNCVYVCVRIYLNEFGLHTLDYLGFFIFSFALGFLTF
jgi:hypothetical protein